MTSTAFWRRVAKTSFPTGCSAEPLQAQKLTSALHLYYQSFGQSQFEVVCAARIRSYLIFIMSYPQFFQQPFRYLRWASHEKPAIFYSFVIGLCGPASFFVAPPIRRFFNDGPREMIPLTYPSKLLPNQRFTLRWICYGTGLLKVL